MNPPQRCAVGRARLGRFSMAWEQRWTVCPLTAEGDCLAPQRKDTRIRRVALRLNQHQRLYLGLQRP